MIVRANPPLLTTWAPTRRAFTVRGADVLRVAIALLVVANLGRIPVFSTGEREAPVLVNDLCVAAFVVTGFAITFARRSFRLDRVGFVALTFAAVGAVSALNTAVRVGLTSFETLVSLAYLGRWLAYFAIYLVMVNVVRARDVSAVWGTLESTMLTIAGFGIVQAIFLPGFSQLVYAGSRPYLDWDPQGHRLVSTILDPNIAGAMLMAILLVELAQISVGVRVPRWKPLVLFAALVLTLSRSSALGLVLGIGVIVAVYGVPKRLLRAAAVAFVIALAALPKLVTFAASYNKLGLSDASAMARLAAWGMALKVFADHPWIGSASTRMASWSSESTASRGSASPTIPPMEGCSSPRCSREPSVSRCCSGCSSSSIDAARRCGAQKSRLPSIEGSRLEHWPRSSRLPRTASS
jgi:hypothetical protein